MEYIESTSGGQQWIDLGFSPSNHPNLLKSEIDLQYTVLPTGSGQGLGGAYTNGSSYYLVYGATASAFKLQSGGDTMEVTWPSPDTERHTFILDQKAVTATLDGNSGSKALSGSTEGVTTTVTLFAMNSSSSSPIYYSVMRLYSAKFWANDALIRDLVPCYEVATGTAGLYDLVNNKFYTNANTGSTTDFVVGPDAYTAGDAVTVNSPAALYTFDGVCDSYNAVTGVVTRRVKVENGVAVAALPETEWTAEQYTATALTRYAGLNCAAYKNSYAAPITVVHTPASVTLSESEFTYNGSAQKPTVKVEVNGTTLTEGTDYTVTWPDDVTSAGEKQIRITINNADYNGTLIRTYTVKQADDPEPPQSAYIITFDPNGGSVTPTTGITGADGRLTELPTPTRGGSYTFDGWYTAASGGTRVTVSTAFDADTTIYARWTYTGSSSSKYPITVPADVSNGAVAASSKIAGRGTVVTITVTPDEGYKLDTLTATDAGGSKLTLTDKGNGVYTYVMPASKVSIEATFTEITDAPESPAGPFVDVKKEDYFYDAVQWAVDNGITEGTSATTFSPNAVCTRAQMVTFLWRAAGCPMPDGSENPFTDVAADTYYYIAVLWAVENGITNGTSADTFSPDAVCTRAQAVTFLHRAAGMPEADAANTFTDVRADAYYTGAVDWAVREEITNGTGNNAFSPDADCTRGQIVTFLYRAAQ